MVGSSKSSPSRGGKDRAAAGAGRQPSTRRGRPLTGPLTIRAIGQMGWVVAERTIDHPTVQLVEDAVAALRASVRAESGWSPRIAVVDGQGRDVTRRCGIDPW